MITRHFVIGSVACLLVACVSHEGIYSPACMAFAGDRIELANNQFVWEKFTDSVVVDSEGEIVNQFPGYPMRGSYRVDGQAVILEAVGGEALESMYLHRQDDRLFLLTAEQFRASKDSGEHASCALALGRSAH